ncbi:3-oxoacid CoA-transferase subunit A [Rhodobacter capsulatus]|uniref:CoA transferase subunit A n=1 Tax=Rhodobacter capsulatus TaxID=1061 RepID=UPI0006DD02D1|nr:3-oxoacid CoA-transferase subunit A [Rhodobacter capsulatus]KQB13886.1 acetyl-CoA--acetoacetyl-CoA transferase subunit alpha [Rhodobacter capsulatus]KQB13910.1 acetyl-CoA--acetoacetyl-CoA transferase subunit alpha [Rhodobacter capsulatus]PZX21221.1 acetate CoA/acetoacetate CoA-transferase alpha subunit [Rhodobacter capsulatus]QNR62545.1 3-oxoacid CoA-transferase subunit A [Rhodobacter capsulatus]
MKGALTPEAAAERIPDGARVMIGGFVAVGSPLRLIDALVARGARGLTVIANDTARPGLGIGKLISAGCVARVIASHIGLNPDTQRGLNEGRIAVDLVPQGTLVERIRAGGMGLGGVLTPTGLGTEIAAGKQILEIEGRSYLLELPLRADFALIGAWQADHVGNLIYEFTAQNFNPVMALAADTVIAEPESIVPVGVIPPDAVRTPGVLVDHLLVRAR